MTSRRSYPGDNMYGARSSRLVDSRETIPLSHVNSIPRRQNAFSADERASRGKAVDDDRIRRDVRVTGFVGKPRVGIEPSDRADVASPYSSTLERRGYRDDGMVRADELTRGETPRFRDSTSRGERSLRSAFSEVSKWVRNGTYDSLTFDGTGTLRGSDYLPKSSSSSALLSGLIVESHKRMILDCSQKGSFGLPFDDRRLAEQVGPGTKVFLLDANSRDLHGVFQAESYPTIDIDASTLRVSEVSSLRVRVHIAKECLPLSERQYKDIIQDNFYTNSKFTPGLSKEQVTKLLHSFRSVDAGRNSHIPLGSSRRTLDSSLSQSSPDFQSISDEIVYRKEERWRRGGVETRSFSTQDTPRYSSKLPVQGHSGKGLDDYEDYEVHEVIENVPISNSRLVSGSNPYSTSRGKQQHSVRGLSGARTSLTHLVGGVSHHELKLTEGDWRDEIETRNVVYRKRQPLSSSSLDDLKRRDRSLSPAWKDVHPRGDAGIGDIYERTGKGGYKGESAFISSSRRRHNDIDLNVPLDMGHGEPSHLHDLDSKPYRKRAWDEDEDKRYDDKKYSLSPPKGRPHLPRNPLRVSDHLLPSNVDDYEDSRLDSRHMVNLSRKDFSLLRSHERARTVAGSFSNGKLGKLHPRPGLKSFPRDKSALPSILRRKPVSGRDIHEKESAARNPKVPVFRIKANLQAPGRGKSERVVRLINAAKSRPRLEGPVEKDGFRPWASGTSDDKAFAASQARKRKASVWSRITLPAKGSVPKVGGSKARVFSRLGPSSVRTRDESYGHKKKKLRAQEVGIEAAPEGLEGKGKNVIAVADSPDALEGEDYLADDIDTSAEGSDKDVEKGADDLHGWTRKKTSVVTANSGDESGNPDHGDYANAKGGRRKLVRPSIGSKGEAVESGWQNLESTTPAGEDAEKAGAQAQQGSPSADSMDLEMANAEAQEVEDGFENADSPLGSPANPNSPQEDGHPESEEDNMMS